MPLRKNKLVTPVNFKRLSAFWILYDIASSGYILLMAAVAFPLYFKVHVTGNAPWSDALWGLLLCTSSVTAGIVAPIVGAAADLSGRRLRYLSIATAVCCIATLCLARSEQNITVIATLFCLSYIGYLVAAGLYDAVFKAIAPSSRAGYLSCLGWGLGYIGGFICYALSKSFLGADLNTKSDSTFSMTFLVVGLYYGVVGGVALAGLSRLRQPEQNTSTSQLWKSSVTRVFQTARAWRVGGQLPRLIIGAHIVTGAAGTLGLFTPIILAGSFGLEVHQVALLSAIFSIVAIPATLGAGVLSLRFRQVHILYGLTPLWLALVVILLLGSGWWAGLAVALGLGTAIGPTNSLTRSLVAVLIDEADSAQMFGFAALVNRLTTAIGTLVFGIVSSISGIQWPAIAITGTVLVVGLLAMPRKRRMTE